MNSYHHLGTMAVASVDTDNLAGFGARRFMEDLYQPQNGPTRGNDYYTQHAGESPLHTSYHQRGESQHHYHNHYAHSTVQSTRPSRDQYQAMSDAARHQQPTSLNRDAANGLHADREDHGRQYHANRSQYDQNSRQAARSAAPIVAAAVHANRAPRSGPVLRSDSLESSASDSTAGLAYTRSGDSQYSQSIGLEREAPPHASRSAPIPRIRLANRATIYDDDYEEPAHSNDIDDMPRPASPASATLGDVSTDGSFTIVRATVLEPDLPKAKCADCGEKLAFEELAHHSCEPRGFCRTPMLTIQVPPSSSSSTLSSSASTSPALATPRSPFFDEYDTLVGEMGPMSPSLFGSVTSLETSRVREDDDETPKAHAVRVVGTQAAIKVSHLKASTHGEAADAHALPPSPPDQALAMQRSATDPEADAAAARRKVIEEQRAPKRKETSLPRAATTSDLAKHVVCDDDRTKVVPKRGASTSAASSKRAPWSSEGQHAKKESSSSLSSTGTNASERMALSSKHPLYSRIDAVASSTSHMTPSSSYERIDDGVGKPLGGCKKAAKQFRERSPVDLSSIEEMMKGLTASPEPLQRRLTDVTRRSEHEAEATRVDAHRPRSAKQADKTDRERALEHELERLRDKERTRQLQALRQKERRKKDRATKRCCICDCSLSSSRTPFVERDGKFLCARDWKELYLPKCRKCNLSVEKGAVKSSDGALRGVFHRSCFSCAACEAPFTDGSFYVFNNQPYCSRHYHGLNGSLCRECQSGIEGDCRQTETGDRFHPYCFSCQHSSKNGVCKETLADYYMVGGQQFCERHANKVSRRLAKAGQKQLDLRVQKRMTMLHSLR